MLNNEKLKITAVILTLNEENNIRHCLSRLDWVDRIVIVDSVSADNTIEIAKEYGCDIYINPWPGFADQRNWAIDNTEIETGWVIFVDADEEVTPESKAEIYEILGSTSLNAFYLCFRVMLFDQWVKRSANFPVWHPRLIRLGKVRFKNAFTGHGETWNVDGEAGYIKSPCNHYSFSKGLDSWFDKHNRLSAIECNAYLINKKTTIYSLLIRLFSRDLHKRRQTLRELSYRIPFRPYLRFLHQLILKGGILDGPAGWTYCTLYLAYEIMISAKIKEKKHLSRAFMNRI